MVLKMHVMNYNIFFLLFKIDFSEPFYYWKEKLTSIYHKESFFFVIGQLYNKEKLRALLFDNNWLHLSYK